MRSQAAEKEKMQLPPDIVEVETMEVSCDGGELGHPKVYLALQDGEAECPYCDRKFVLKPRSAR